MDQDKTHFGFQSVPKSEKADHVANVFHSVAKQYDLMNDLMSLGTHRLIKRMTIELTKARPGHQIMDLAGGTGDLTELLSKKVGPEGQVLLCDINQAMLCAGRDRLLDKGLLGNIQFIQGDAESLPFPDQHFDAITMAFGIRNVTDKARALSEIRRTLKLGGRLVILEFSKLTQPFLQPAYKVFSGLWPKIGQWITSDSQPYQYLIESIEMHPDQESFAEMMRSAGYQKVSYENLAGGIVAIHQGENGGTEDILSQRDN